MENMLGESRIWRMLQDLVKIGTLDSAGDRYRIKVALCESWLRSNYNVERMIREITW
jgi:DNA-binding IclR family transcriptional regulator